MQKIILSVALLALSGVAAQAQQTERFRLEKTERGYVRMDTTTGAMSICEERDGQLICRLAADERTAADATSDHLQTRLDRLEERLARLEAEKRTAEPLPSNEEFDQGLDRMESFFRRFMGIVREFETNPEAQPDRT